jgi:YebC/PmpR family DNA-binding regulatory protein
MSGHSHWATIKHHKEAADKKRGRLFSKLSRTITVSAKQSGDVQMNSALKIAIEQAKKANMPNENIEKAIKKGTGELMSESLEEFCFEAYGINKSALIITGITDNKNRTLHQVKQILASHNAKLAEAGAVQWQFETKGIITVSASETPEEKAEIAAIESGAEDMRWEGEFLEIYTKPQELEQVKKEVENRGISIESASLGWVPKEEICLEPSEKDKLEKLFSALDDNDDVQQVYSNVKL